MPQQQFKALNGLRLFAALAVICFHYGALTRGFSTLPHFVRNVASNGGIALPFFFLLSGFVLAHAYQGRLSTSGSRGEFYRARVARLYPVYVLSFLLYLPIAVEKYLRHPAAGQHNGAQIYAFGSVLTLVGLQSWTPLSQAWNGPGWSLSVEAFFYLAFPFLLPRIVRMRSGHLFAILGALWISMVSLTLAHELEIIGPDTWSRYIMYQPVFWMPVFLLGMATYRFAHRWSQIPNRTATLIATGCLIVLLLLCGLPPATGGDFFVNGGAAPLMALGVLAYSHPSCLSSRVMGGRVLAALGAMSYVIYILQAPIWHIFQWIVDKIHPKIYGGQVEGWRFIAYLLVLLGFSYLAQRVVEKPAQRRILDARRRNQAEVEERVRRLTSA